MAAEALNILIMAALYQEVRLFLRARRARRLPEAALPTWEFKAGEGRGAAVISGMREAPAREAAALALARYDPETLLAAGFGGAVDPALPPELDWAFFIGILNISGLAFGMTLQLLAVTGESVRRCCSC